MREIMKYVLCVHTRSPFSSTLLAAHNFVFVLAFEVVNGRLLMVVLPAAVVVVATTVFIAFEEGSGYRERLAANTPDNLRNRARLARNAGIQAAHATRSRPAPMTRPDASQMQDR